MHHCLRPAEQPEAAVPRCLTREAALRLAPARQLAFIDGEEFDFGTGFAQSRRQPFAASPCGAGAAGADSACGPGVEVISSAASDGPSSIAAAMASSHAAGSVQAW